MCKQIRVGESRARREQLEEIFKRAANIIEKIRYLITQVKVIELARAILIEQGYWSLYNGIFVLFLSLL